MKKPKILRKRYIPDEIVDISSDELLYRDEQILVTRWNTIKPRKDISWGISYTFLNEGYKISKFFDKESNFLYWYCDILDICYNHQEDEYVLKDLLIDVKIYPDGKLQLLDLDEFADAVKKKILTGEQIIKGIEVLDALFEIINEDKFPPDMCLEKYIAVV